MSFFLAVITGEDKKTASFNLIKKELKEEYEDIELFTDNNENTGWNDLVIRHAEGKDIVLISKTFLNQSSSGLNKKILLRNKILKSYPKSAAKWLDNYIRKKAKTIYEFYPTDDMHLSRAWQILFSSRLIIWEQLRGVLYTKDEGFTNPEGDLILWDYPDFATGFVSAAVLRFNHFHSFSLNLASPKARGAFLKGKIPSSR